MKNDESTNVIAFEPRRPEAPELKFVEMKLNADGGGLEMLLYDEAGNVAAVLSYGLQDKPRNFLLQDLVDAWDRWRGHSAVAS